ncbi:FAD-binding oxidoreductase [SAR202 cluster bacterium AD-804-J14_MRT_500m]|nr:FAD-binding oxidoreductase [SAR202 cluster bacterium AD-804-J14_MRT_500m]
MVSLKENFVIEKEKQLAKSADVVIIGAGIVGCAAAYYLSKRGSKVVLIDKGKVGWEQSGRNWGFVRQQGRHPLELPLMLEGNKIWQNLEQELEADIEWVQGGNLRIASDDKDMAVLERMVCEERDIGLNVQVVGRQDVEKLIPSIGTNWGVGGMFTSTDGHAEPIKVTRAYATAAKNNGTLLYEHCAAEDVVTTGNQISGVITEHGEISTSTVICAAGAWSSQIGRMIGLDLPQRKVRATVAATQPLPYLTTSGVWASDVSFRQKIDGSLYIAAGGAADIDLTFDMLHHWKTFLPNYKKNWKTLRFHVGFPLMKDLASKLPWSRTRQHPFAHVVDQEPKPNKGKVKTSRVALMKLFPSLNDVSIRTCWAGYIDVTPDMVPVLGETRGISGFVFATGFSGHGFAMGPIVGRSMAELIFDGRSVVNIHGLRYDRFLENDLAPVRDVI